MISISASDPVAVALALGSNLGDREDFLHRAGEALRPRLDDVRISRWYETDPVGVAGQPPFLNAVATGRTRLPARDLLALLLSIEEENGRARPFPGAPRTLDLDLIFYGDAIINEPGLTVPHPRMRERTFVLGPLAEIAANWIDPVTGLTVEALLARLVTEERNRR